MLFALEWCYFIFIAYRHSFKLLSDQKI